MPSFRLKDPHQSNVEISEKHSEIQDLVSGELNGLVTRGGYIVSVSGEFSDTDIGNIEELFSTELEQIRQE